MKIYSLVVGILLLTTSCGGKIHKASDVNYVSQDTIKTATSDKFFVLNFMANNKPCTANISTKYVNFTDKRDYSLSVFITVNQKKTKERLVIMKDSVQFNKLEQEILKSIRKFSTCYIGNTNMNSFRDLIFYIKQKDQKGFSSELTNLKTQHPEIKSFIFEEDPKWEAVSEFYSAIK